MSIKNYYVDLLGKSREVLDAVVDDEHLEKSFCKVHNYVQDYEIFAESLGKRPERQMLVLAIREYQWGLYAAAMGNYRHANISLSVRPIRARGVEWPGLR